jgi:hypothetical protein
VSSGAEGVPDADSIPSWEDTMVRTRLAFVLLAACAAFTLPAASADDAGFTKLFNGTDLTGFKVFPENIAATFVVKDGAVQVSGKPAGYFYTEKTYKNFVLKFDWKYARPANLTDDSKFGGNSGLLVHITGPHKVWPNAIEVQGMNRDHGKIFGIAPAKGTFKDMPDVRKRVLKPVGEWNTTEVISQDGSLTAKVNGEIVCEGKGELTEGPLGWQSEGAEIHFKNIMIKELK